jgi:hypothetical protein
LRYRGAGVAFFAVLFLGVAFFSGDFLIDFLGAHFFGIVLDAT